MNALRNTQDEASRRRAYKERLKWDLVRGVLILGFSAIFAGVSREHAQPGEFYLVPTGAFLLGVFYLLRALNDFLNTL